MFEDEVGGRREDGLVLFGSKSSICSIALPFMSEMKVFWMMCRSMGCRLWWL